MYVLHVKQPKEVAKWIHQGSQPLPEGQEIPQEADSSEVERGVTPTHSRRIPH